MGQEEEIAMLSTNGARLDNGGENFIVVNAMLLKKTSADPTGFIARERTIGVKFLAKHPFARNNIGITRRRNELPGLVGEQSLKFFVHGSSPIMIEKSKFISLRKWRKRSCSNGEVKTINGKTKAGFGTSTHGMIIVWGKGRNGMRR
jgi:hypothetical protein